MPGIVVVLYVGLAIFLIVFALKCIDENKKMCPKCKKFYSGLTAHCPDDDTPLITPSDGGE